MGFYYVTVTKHPGRNHYRAKQGVWYEVVARSSTNAIHMVMKFFNSPRNDGGYTKSMFRVRKTPPTKGDILRLMPSPPSRKIVCSDNVIPYKHRRLASPSRREREKTKPKKLWEKQFAALVELSRGINMPIYYTNDLNKHDRATLSKYSPKQFIWMVRDTGTDIIPMDKNGAPLSIKDYLSLRTWVDACETHNTEKYLFTGTRFRKISYTTPLAEYDRVIRKHYPKLKLPKISKR